MNELIEKKEINTIEGRIQYSLYYRQKFIDEEDNEKYIPKEIKEICVLELISVNQKNQGHGDKLMNIFLKKIDHLPLIILDVVPMDSKIYEDNNYSENLIIEKLISFYEKYGFKKESNYSLRMYINNSSYKFPNK